MKRIALFLATNLAVILVISIVLSVLGINSRSGGMGQMLAYAAVVGFTGSIISLLLSKTMAKHSVGAQVITTPRSEVEAWLLQTVQNQAQQWNLKTPEVAIYQSPEPNAFATGATRNSSLVAVSTGLLNSMTRDEVEAVLAHEMAHVGNGDMVTLTLIQGVVNTFVVFFARIIASMVAQGRNDSESSNNGIYMLVNFVLQILFGFLASFIVMWFSRQRIPRRRRRSQTGGRAQNDCRPATPERAQQRPAARHDRHGHRQRSQRFAAQHPPQLRQPHRTAENDVTIRVNRFQAAYWG